MVFGSVQPDTVPYEHVPASYEPIVFRSGRSSHTIPSCTLCYKNMRQLFRDS